MAHTYKVNSVKWIDGKCHINTIAFFNDKQETIDFMKKWAEEWDTPCHAIKGAAKRACFFTHKGANGKVTVFQ